MISRPAKSRPATLNSGVVSCDDPRNGGEQQQAHDQGQRQADKPGAVALLRWQLVGKDRDENEIVDAKHDLEHDKRGKTNPGIGVGNPVQCPVHGEVGSF